MTCISLNTLPTQTSSLNTFPNTHHTLTLTKAHCSLPPLLLAVQVVIDLDAITLELDNLQRAAQESLVELTISQTSRDLDTLEKVAQEKLAELGGSEANEELDQVIQQLMAEAARLSPLPSEPTRLSTLTSEPTRLSPLLSKPTRLSPPPSEPT